MVTKTSRPFHFGQIQPQRSFDAIYAALPQNPNHIYHTTGNQRPFTATAQIAVRGAHAGQPVIVFRTNGIERARAYKCCWSYQTNCNRTYIDCYIMAL